MRTWNQVVCIVGGLLFCTATLMAQESVAELSKRTAQHPPPSGVADKQPGERDCDPGEVAIDIEIMTDDWPGETTWEVVEYPSGTVLCSGGPYGNDFTLYTEQCCVPDDACVHFVISDSYGDGLCCCHGDGYYNVYYNGTLVGTGGEFGVQEMVQCLGDTCPPDCVEYACCVGLSCQTVHSQAECDGLGGVFFSDDTCEYFVCPQDCSEETIWGQPADDCSGSWSAAMSGMGAGGPPTGFWYRVFEDFPELACEIDDIHWWDLLLHYDAGWNECANPAAVQFLIQFWADDGAGMPLNYFTGPPVCTYGPLSPSYTALGGACNGFQLYYFSVDPLRVRNEIT
ncbi:MAG: hypothetical protein KAY37_17765, partial [Phycisphaerae bacterium]|nr:hypothetical protein [Phycisphaerae bacterium]